MKYYIIAGEASGDLHGRNLMNAIKKQDNQAQFRVWGGDLMKEAGAELVSHYKERAYMGFLEVILHLKKILGFIDQCKADLEKNKPDVLILIDYPGFNLRIAPFAKSLGIKVHYYISPQIWAWKEGRVKQIKEFVDYMYVILPFEKKFYQKWNYSVDFVGHPLLDEVENFKADPDFRIKNNLDPIKKIIALLPGSRKQEIKKMLGIMSKMPQYFKDYEFVIAGAPGQEESFYKKVLPNNTIKIIFGQTYSLLNESTAALVTSGTATLETAIFGVPEVVCYKGSKISYLIAKQLVKNIKYISLVNLIMDYELVKELIQDSFNEENLKKELSLILETSKRDKIINKYHDLRNLLGGSGASDHCAKLIVERDSGIKN
mgnify:CR=1 FL=1